MSTWTDRKPHTATETETQAFKRSRKWFGCLLCGKTFGVGDGYRWVFANYSEAPFRHGNFFVCDACDEGDVPTIQKAATLAESLKQREHMAERIWRGRWELRAIQEERR